MRKVSRRVPVGDFASFKASSVGMYQGALASIHVRAIASLLGEMPKIVQRSCRDVAPRERISKTEGRCVVIMVRISGGSTSKTVRLGGVLSKSICTGSCEESAFSSNGNLIKKC